MTGNVQCDTPLTGRVDQLTLPEKVGQLFQVGFDGTTVTEPVCELIDDYQVGGLVYFDRNVETPEQLAQLSVDLQKTATAESGIPLLLSVDQEGGLVTRIPFGTEPPGQMALGATGDPELAREFGATIGRQLRSVGITMNFAPVLDVNSNPDNPVIGTRSFGDDPDLVAELGAAVATGFEASGVGACSKHFPGHGDTDLDSHESLPVVHDDRERLDAVEFPPFRAAIDADVDAIMSTHVSFPAISGDPELPATLSRAVLTDLLREELGFEGLIVTDCLEMSAISDEIGTVEGAVRAVEAGADQLLISRSPSLAMEAIESVTAAVRGGRIAESRVNESVRRVLRVKNRRPPTAKASSDSEGLQRLVETSRRVAARALTVVRDDADLLPVTGRRIVLWDPRTVAESPGDAVGSLADQLTKRDVEVRQSIGDANELAVNDDEVVVAVTTDTRSDPHQIDVVRSALERHPSVMLLAVSNPYVLGTLSDVQTAVTTYDTSPAMLATASDVLAGIREACGSLPITFE